MHLLLDEQRVSLVNRRQKIHQQDLSSYLKEGIIHSHKKFHGGFLGLEILQPLIDSTHTLTTSTLRKWTQILQLIPQNLELNEVISE